MSDMPRTYIAIDLKSFYASVECAERHLDPLTTNLVVADASRTDKTICLAVSPSLKAQGIPGRPRLFEVIQKTREINAKRLRDAIRQGKAARTEDKKQPYAFSSSSFDALALAADPSLELSYIVAPPQMRKYMEYSTRIFQIYMRHVSSEDIHVYSVDECFIDVTRYLSFYHMTARELAMTMIREVLFETGITATCGIAPNLYLCKIAMDIVAKHQEPDKDGVRVAELDEISYRRLLWAHTPLTDFWRIGRGTVRRLESVGLHTMGDVARCSIGKPNEFYNARLLYKLFGVHAEVLIDHAWGWEPTTVEHIKAYRPENRSISSGQVLHCPYNYEKCQLIVREMTELLALDLVEKQLVTDQIVLSLGYDAVNLESSTAYDGPVTTDRYGRSIPKPAHGSINLGGHTSSTKLIMEKVMALYAQIASPVLFVRRVNITANHVSREKDVPRQTPCEQLNFLTDYNRLRQERRAEEEKREKERSLQQAMLEIKRRFGKNAILKGMNLEEGGTTIERNSQVGGHRA